MKTILLLLVFVVGNIFGSESYNLVERVSIWHRDFHARYAGRISGAELMRAKAFNYIISDGISRFHDLSEHIQQIEKHQKIGLDPKKIPKVDTVMICEIKLGKGAAYFYVSDDGVARWIDEGEPLVELAVIKRTLVCLPVAEYIDFLETFPGVKTQCFPDIDLRVLRAGVAYTRGKNRETGEMGSGDKKRK